MKAVMRVITFVGPQIVAAVRPCLSALAGMLVEVSCEVAAAICTGIAGAGPGRGQHQSVRLESCLP